MELLFSKVKQLLIVAMWFIALHSFVVGVCMIVMPIKFLHYFGFDITERFFLTQGGVFHIVMSVAYVMSVSRGKIYSNMLVFSFSAKFIATIFLVFYYTTISQNWVILLSGIGDCIMGIVILKFYSLYIQTEKYDA
ncbi:MAG: hypothetical protein ISR90_00415 [Candidatus Marinimicrobia bacterium]|nr:hypothetical protein [Candidatus Neomarinimicrobiota bacterium]MBL7022505.1 hypothetical protein [Candidatus Neomarinimicrobiota bacterium]MBL7108640.1 hypothetical protein [Candidatus Neomarinimicrobiota bacterium]